MVSMLNPQTNLNLTHCQKEFYSFFDQLAAPVVPRTIPNLYFHQIFSSLILGRTLPLGNHENLITCQYQACMWTNICPYSLIFLPCKDRRGAPILLCLHLYLGCHLSGFTSNHPLPIILSSSLLYIESLFLC